MKHAFINIILLIIIIGFGLPEIIDWCILILQFIILYDQMAHSKGTDYSNTWLYRIFKLK
jgi:hypothetical protein